MKKLIGSKGFYKMVLAICIPIVIQNGFTNLASLLDNIMIGQLGTLSMSGVSITNQLLQVFNVTIFGAMSGPGIFMAQFYGKKNKEGVENCFRIKLIIGIIIALLAIFLFYTFGQQLISLYLNDNPQDSLKTLNYGMDYLKIMLIGLIPFVITQVTGKFDGEYAILASRKLALRRIETYNFKTSKHQKEALVKVGDTVDAVVLSAGFHAVMVNVKGVDTFIQQFQLTHRYVKIVKDMYSTGMTIPVVIKNITYDEKGNVEKLEVSGREAEIQGFIPKMKNITENSRCLAHITRISHRQDGRVRIHLFIDDFGVPAYAIAARVENTATAPNSGDTVLFQVLRKNEDTGYVAGKIIQTVHKQM